MKANIKIVVGSVGLAFACTGVAAPVALTTEYQENPVGIDAEQPRLAWKLGADVVRQRTYQLETDGVAQPEVASADQIGVAWPGVRLTTGSRHAWRVRVRDEKGSLSDWSEPASFVVGKRDAWRAEWIGNGFDRQPAFEKRFAVTGKVVRATLFITAPGYYEAQLNGRKVGDKVLDPSPTAYDKRVLYSTYDLKGDLKRGENELLILLGHGWYDNRAVATWNFEVAPWRDFPRTIAQLDIAYADGTKETVATDASWRQVANPVVYDDVYEGEVLDGRVRAGAELPGGPLMAVEVDGPRGRLVPEEQPGAKVMKEVRASAVHPLGDGACLIEFPVNVAGWMRLPLYGQKSGDVVSFRYDERANADGTPAVDSVRDGLHDKGSGAQRETRSVDHHFRYTASHRFCAKDAAFQCDRYICRGEDGETYEPRFSYKGFRYVLVRGLARLPKAEDAVARFVHTAADDGGTLEWLWQERADLSRGQVRRCSLRVNKDAYDGAALSGFPLLVRVSPERYCTVT